MEGRVKSENAKRRSENAQHAFLERIWNSELEWKEAEEKHKRNVQYHQRVLILHQARQGVWCFDGSQWRMFDGSQEMQFRLADTPKDLKPLVDYIPSRAAGYCIRMKEDSPYYLGLFGGTVLSVRTFQAGAAPNHLHPYLPVTVYWSMQEAEVAEVAGIAQILRSLRATVDPLAPQGVWKDYQNSLWRRAAELSQGSKQLAAQSQEYIDRAQALTSTSFQG